VIVKRKGADPGMCYPDFFMDVLESSVLLKFSDGPIEDKTLIIRHDVDMSLNHALKFATAESIMGIHSTYFLLHTAKYFDYSRTLLKKCERLLDMGHDIGIHIDMEVNKSPMFFLSKPLRFLRKHGIPVNGASLHGSRKRKRETGIDTMRMWNDNFLEPLGLEYEAYHLKGNAYLSDCGSKWLGFVSEEGDTFANMQEYPNLELRVSQIFREMNHGLMQILIHPYWWDYGKAV